MGFLVSIYVPSKRIKANDSVFPLNLTFSSKEEIRFQLECEYFTIMAQGLKETQAWLSKLSR